MNRTATLTDRLIKILTRKREKLLFYKLLLENLRTAVAGDHMDKVAVYTEMGRMLTGELEALQTALNSLETLYRTADPTGDGDCEIVSLSGEVLHLQACVREAIEENCLLLKTRMEGIRTELSNLRLPRTMKPIFGDDTARRFDISF